MASKTTSLHVAIAKGSQDLKYTEIVRFGEHRLRIEMRADSYVAQSWAKVERWNGSEWAELYTIEGALMQTTHKLYYLPGQRTAKDFAADRAELMARAAEILE